MKKIILLLIVLFLFASGYYFFNHFYKSKTSGIYIDMEIPSFALSNLENDQDILTNNNIVNEILVINFFASWCIPCKEEHHLFFELKKEYPTLKIIGVNHKDNYNDAVNFLNNNGNPYDFVGVDHGKIGLEFGVFGLPETFITDGEGKIIYKHMGPLNKEIIYNEITPFLLEGF